jgi:hypothetical protein
LALPEQQQNKKRKEVVVIFAEYQVSWPLFGAGTKNKVCMRMPHQLAGHNSIN